MEQLKSILHHSLSNIHPTSLHLLMPLRIQPTHLQLIIMDTNNTEDGAYNCCNTDVISMEDKMAIYGCYMWKLILYVYVIFVVPMIYGVHKFLIFIYGSVHAVTKIWKCLVFVMQYLFTTLYTYSAWCTQNTIFIYRYNLC